MRAKRETTRDRVSTLGKTMLLLCAGLLAGCASSGDVEQVRQEREQAKAKMSAELQQERTLAATMERESEAQKAQAEKLAKAFGGKPSAAPKPMMAAPLRSGSPMSLTTALLPATGCLAPIPAQAPNPAVPSALFIGTLPGGGNSPCTSVTISTTDTNNNQFSAVSPLIPVVVGSGGTLTLTDPGAGNATTLYASSFLIQNTGMMSAGSATTPVAGHITIIMAGNASAALPPTTGDQNPNMRDITVMDGGTLALYGAKGLSATPGTMNNDIVSGTKSWTYLAVPAGPAKYNDGENVSTPVPTTNPDTTLTLANAVDWQVGDWISVATTSFSSHQTEIVQICAITSVANPEKSAKNPISGVPAQVSQITLRNGTNCTATPNNTPLKHYHYGGLAPTPGFFPANTTQPVVSGGNPINVSYQAKSFYDGPDRNYGIDERAEVALLSRNIKLASVAGQRTDATNFIGGHLVAMVTGTTAPSLTLVGVEIEKFGQGLVGRYPVHLHKLPQYQVTGATNATPIVITASASVPANGTQVAISGVQGNTTANGTWTVTTGGSLGPNQFSLNGSNGTGSGTYTSGGIWTPATILIQDVSVHHSYNKCYVVHGTGNANLYNNVCVRMVGQGVYLEDGTGITGNQFMRNFIAGAMASATTYSYPQQNGSLYWDGDNLQNSYAQGGSISNATNASPIVVTTSNNAPATSTQVVISGVSGNTNANGTWTVTNTGSNTFSLNGSTGNGTFANATWSTNNANGANGITSIGLDPGNLLAIQTRSTPTAGTQVTISNTGTAADGTWIVTNVIPGPPTFSLVGSKGKSPGSYSCCNGTWSASNIVTAATNASPIVITSPTSLNAGAQVTVAGVAGNTAANGSFGVTGIDATHFSLNGSSGNGAFTAAAWQKSGANPTWYTVSGIPDTSASGANGSVGPDVSFPGGFWITNLGNTFVNNSVAGCQAMGRGYWLLTQNNQRYAYPEFTGNRVHGCYNGIDANVDTVNAINPAPTMTNQETDQAPVVLLNGNTVTRSRQRAFWGRGIFFTLHDNRFATNPYGFALLGGGGPEGNLPGFWGMARDNVIAGMTRNNVERYPGCALGNVPVGSGGANLYSWATECTDVTLYWANNPPPSWGNYPSANMNIQGYSYYDGPARIEHTRFVNFRFDPTGIQSDPAARLLTKTDIQNIATNGMQGQLEGLITAAQAAPNSAPSANYQGYAGDPAMGWIQSNQQTVPPTQYVRDSIWDNVDFKHQVYTEAVNMGPFNDGDKTTVILDEDSQLTGLKVVDGNGRSHKDLVPVSLNNLDYYATDFTVDEPHSRGPNDFRATSLMSPHKYATLNIESATNPPSGFRVAIQRDMPAYASTVYPSLFLNGRGQKPIYEPFVMDRMGYTVYGMTGVENEPTTQSLASFMPQLLFSYTDPHVKKSGEYFVNRIAVYQPVATPANIKVYRVRRQWGQQYTGGVWPPHYVPPIASSCDGVFFSGASSWSDCISRATNQPPYNAAPYTQLGYPYGMTLTAAASWQSFDQSYKDLMNGTTTVAQFIANQTFFYDPATSMLYFYMIEDSPVQHMHSPYGTCGGGKPQYAANVTALQGIKNFSDPGSVKAALDASCLVVNEEPQPTDLVTCGPIGCAAYLVDLSAAVVQAPPAPTVPITGATNGAPIVVTTSGTAPATGTMMVISGVQGNTAANGIWTVTNTGTNTFSLNNSNGAIVSSPRPNGAYTSGGAWSQCCAPGHPIAGTAYATWNQYRFVYGTPAQQPNGLPVVANPAIGNTAPPQDGTALTGKMTPTDGTPPPTGDQVTYAFLALDGSLPTVTENFRYRCLTTSPWAPVNARGAYPSGGGANYPLAPSVCMVAQGFAVMEAGVVLQVTVTNPGSGYTSPPTVTITPPAGGMQAQGVATIANGSVTGVTMTNQGSGYTFGPQVTFSPPGP